MGPLIAGIIGLFLGSFLTFLTSRLIDQNGSIMGARSLCGHCGNVLKWYDLIPVFSYFLLKGRCRHCQQQIPFYFPLVELFMGLLSGFIVLRLAPVHVAGFWIVQLGIWVGIIIMDSRIMRIHDLFLYGLLANSLVLAFLAHLLVQRLLQAVLLTVGVGLVAFLLGKLLRKQAMGEADYYLLAALGLSFTLENVLLSIFLASVLGIATALVFKKRQLPFGSLLGSAVICISLGGWL